MMFLFSWPKLIVAEKQALSICFVSTTIGKSAKPLIVVHSTLQLLKQIICPLTAIVQIEIA